MAANFASAAETELACGVCFQFFVKPHEPKNLPKCPHILCQICLQKMTEGGLKTVKCPQCNKISFLNKRGIDGWTTSLALRNLAERHPEGIKQFKKCLKSQLKCGQEKNTNQVTKLKEVIKQTRHAIQIEEQEIEKAVQAVLEKSQELIQQLKNTSGLHQLQEQLSKLETEIKHAKTTVSKLGTMTDKEFHAQTDAITNQIEKLKIDEINENTASLRVGKFIANIQLGRIVKSRQLELVKKIDFIGACAIASNTNGTLAVCDCKSDPPQVSVFQKDSMEFKGQSKFPVQQMSDKRHLLGLILSEEGKYFVTKFGVGFDVYNTDGKFQKTESVVNQQSKLKNMNVQSGSICRTNDGRILVGSAMKTTGNVSRKYIVTVHDKEGRLMKTIPIGIGPIQIADINGTHFAVCNSIEDEKVCVYDMQTGEETLSIDVITPFSLCYDKQTDCLLIARMTDKDENGILGRDSGVIEQYCRKTGMLITCLAHGLQWPRKLIITEDNILAIADEGTVKLYKMD